MKIKRKNLKKLVEVMLNEITPGLIHDQPAAGKIARDIGKQKTLPSSDESHDIIYALQMLIADKAFGFPYKIMNNMRKPLALRGFAKFWSQDRNTFTEKNMTSEELKILTYLVYMKFQHIYLGLEKPKAKNNQKKFKGLDRKGRFRKLVNFDSRDKKLNIYFDYDDYKYIPELDDNYGGSLAFRRNNVADKAFEGKDRKTIALNINKFLGQFRIVYELKKEGERVMVNAKIYDTYDFSSQDKKTGKLKRKFKKFENEKGFVGPSFLVEYLFERFWNGMSDYASVRRAIGKAAQYGLNPYEIEINLKDINKIDSFAETVIKSRSKN